MLTICSVVLAPRGQSAAACGQPAQRSRYGALIEMWPDSRLESLICQRPGLAADYRLRWTGEMRSDPNPQLVALADRRSRRQAAARGRATGRGVVSGPASGTGPSGWSNTRMLPARVHRPYCGKPPALRSGFPGRAYRDGKGPGLPCRQDAGQCWYSGRTCSESSSSCRKLRTSGISISRSRPLAAYSATTSLILPMGPWWMACSAGTGRTG
jgi:hypothetical protein